MYAGWLSKDSLPRSPPPDMLVQFHSRYASDKDLLEARAAMADAAPLGASVRVVRAAAVTNPGRYVVDAMLVEEIILEYMDAYLARFGLAFWCPDMLDSPYSLLNSALRIIVIDTFRQAVSARAYDFLGAKMEHAANTLLLIRFFDHFVFHHQLARFKQNMKNPGSVIAREALKAAYERRRTVCPFRGTMYNELMCTLSWLRNASTSSRNMDIPSAIGRLSQPRRHRMTSVSAACTS
jgi:hypothetical protein